MSSLSAGMPAVLAAALLVSSCSNQTQNNSAPATHGDQPLVTGEPAGYNAADFTFADGLIAQDQQGIDLATLAPSRSSSSDFVTFAASSASARRSEIAVLKVLLAQWNSDQENPRDRRNEAPAKGVVDQATIAKLQSSQGGSFETLWRQSMIGLDKASIDMASAEVANGKNVDAAGMAKQIAEGRQTEIDQMKKMAGA